MRLLSPLAALGAYLISGTLAIDLDVTDSNSVKTAASDIAHGMMTWYNGNETGQVPGLLALPYYWWEAGAMMGSLMDYWYYTGDDTYNDLVSQAMLFQVGPDMNYMPPNQSKDEGNDDQVFWGFAAMTAAEYKFPNPPAGQPQWLALAQGVWNSQQLRWDSATCGGGLRWQIFTFNNGYDYKNSPSNAGFMNLGARLFAYTGNTTYSDWVSKTWDWMAGVNLIGGNGGYSVYDGTSTDNNCTTLDRVQWTYSAGMLLNAAAIMYNLTGSSEWQTRANGLWSSSSVFFKDKIMYEVACEPQGNCDTDQLSFKAYLTRFMAASTKWMPSLYDDFEPYFQASAQAAASQCDGTAAGVTGDACGTKWTAGATWDGSYGIGQQMSALQIVQANLIQSAGYPVTDKTGGISKGDPGAGTGGDESTTTGAPDLHPISTGDRAAAGIATAVVIVVILGGAWWLVS